jgi:hypothetical protein
VILHLVLFNAKPDLDQARRRAFAQSLAACLREIPSIRRSTIGRAISVDPGYARSMGEKTYQYSALLEFEDTDGLISYLKHPRHEVLGGLFWESCESTIVSEHEAVDGRTAGLEEFLIG